MKFIQTAILWYGGSPQITPQIVSQLAKYDLLDISRFKFEDIPNCWSQIKAANPNIKIYIYVLGAEASNKCDTQEVKYLNELGRHDVSRGLPQGALNAKWPQLFLRDKASQRIYNKYFSDPAAGAFSYLMDFGSQDYIKYWLAAEDVDNTKQVWAADGIFVDICTVQSNGSTYISSASPQAPVMPVLYPNEAAWCTAMQTFIKGLRTGLTATGQKTWVNAGSTREQVGYDAWLALDASTNPPDILMEEGAYCVAWGSQVQFYQEAQWKRQVDVVKNLAHSKCTMLSHTQIARDGSGIDNYGNKVTFWQAFYYALASFCLGKNDGSYFFFATGPTYDRIWWYDEYDKIDLGAAIGPYTAYAAAGGATVYWREFEKGYVYVNPTNLDVNVVMLPQPCRQITHENILSDFNTILPIATLKLPRWNGSALLKTIPVDPPKPPVGRKVKMTGTFVGTLEEVA